MLRIIFGSWAQYYRGGGGLIKHVWVYIRGGGWVRRAYCRNFTIFQTNAFLSVLKPQNVTYASCLWSDYVNTINALPFSHTGVMMRSCGKSNLEGVDERGKS